MDVGELHERVRDLNFDIFGVDITIVPVEGANVPAVAIWMTPVTEGQPSSFRPGPQRKEPSKVLALKAADAALITKGARLIAPNGPGGATATWRCDGPSEVFTDHTRFTLVRDTSGC